MQRDIANLKAALEHVDVADAFLPTVAPASIEAHFGNEHYGSQEELLYALADALREEYRAIVEAGFHAPGRRRVDPAALESELRDRAG